MKVELENIRIGHSPVSDFFYAGVLNKDKKSWLHKEEVTGDVIAAVIARWEGHSEELVDQDGNRFEISVKRLDKK